MKKKKKKTTDAANEDSTEIKVERSETEEKKPEPGENAAGEEAVIEEKAEKPAEPPESKEEPEPEPDWSDRFLRLAAEFENFKKRSAREYIQVIKNAEEQLITELTEVLDNLERALDPEHRDAKLEEFVKGIDLIYGQFKLVLEKRGLERIDAVGTPFDPETHEAMMQIDSDDIPEGYVAGEIAPGYKLGDKVIRHSKVMVSRGPAEKAEDEPEEKKEGT